MRYVVMPITGLATLEHPLALVAGDHFVEEPLLDACVVQVVVDHVVAQRGAGHGFALERRDRLTERVGEALRVRLVGIPLEWRRQLELVLDPVEAGGEQGWEGEVRIY